MSPSIVVLTGAGVSADSGLATFRGAGGLWEGQRVEEVATPGAWSLDPALVWRFYQARRAALATVEPNAAHFALERLESYVERISIPFLLVTQNVDDLHDRAGSRALHMHGELANLRCESCGYRGRNLHDLEPERFVPCPDCQFPRQRPDIVWFGEMPYQMRIIEEALAHCTHFISIGTSGAVYPAAGFLEVARAAGAKTIVNSLEEPLNAAPADELRIGRAIDVVPRLVEDLLEELGVNGR